MRLRKLEQKDAPLMLEWMHDSMVTEFLQADFASKTMEDCIAFIKSSQDDVLNLHMGIVDDNDNYMGTVSLKNINDEMAEYAITVRKEAMGKGYSKYAMTEMLRIGMDELHLRGIYWCVNPENKRAIRFYDKNGYEKIKEDKKNMLVEHVFGGGGYSPQQIKKYIWYIAD